MRITEKKLYELIPAIYRIRDEELGKPLEALFRIISREAGVVEENISQTWDNWFIETCDEWLVPYIADLLAVRNIHTIDAPSVYSQRAYVANTLAYRRRKGTIHVLEQLAMDTTGWRTRAVEMFQLLACNQNINHLRLDRNFFTLVRDAVALEDVGTPFDASSRSVDIRHIDNRRGIYNIRNIGLFVWRLHSYGVTRSDARDVNSQPGCFTFSPLGLNQQLFNKPQTETSITRMSSALNVPGMHNRRILHDELDKRRHAMVNQLPVHYGFFGPQDTPEITYPSPWKIYLNNSDIPINPNEILICDLESWKLPPASVTYPQIQTTGDITPVTLPVKVAVDPVLGRIAFPPETVTADVRVSYNYGFAGDLGGGPYDRRKAALEEITRKITWRAGVSKDDPSIDSNIFPTLGEAIVEWNKQKSGTAGLITVMDSRSYHENLTGKKEIKIPESSQLIILAAGWPGHQSEEGGTTTILRLTEEYNARDVRPHLSGNLVVAGLAPAGSSSGGELIINGLLIEGTVTVKEGNLSSLILSHSTCVPQKKSLMVDKGNEQLQILLKRSICGNIQINSAIAGLNAQECIIDGKGGAAMDGKACPVNFMCSTLLGTVTAKQIHAGNCIFTDLLTIERKQEGCIRFSYVPADSKTPGRYRCQPDKEVKSMILHKVPKGKITLLIKNKIKQQVSEWLMPSFSSEEYGSHGYAQLSRLAPEQIKTGADNEAEMGVFNHLKHPQRETNLRIALDEYLPLGMESGVLFIT